MPLLSRSGLFSPPHPQFLSLGLCESGGKGGESPKAHQELGQPLASGGQSVRKRPSPKPLGALSRSLLPPNTLTVAVQEGGLKWSGVPPRTRIQPHLHPGTFIAIRSWGGLGCGAGSPALPFAALGCVWRTLPPVGAADARRCSVSAARRPSGLSLRGPDSQAHRHRGVPEESAKSTNTLGPFPEPLPHAFPFCSPLQALSTTAKPHVFDCPTSAHCPGANTGALALPRPPLLPFSAVQGRAGASSLGAA